MNLVIAGTGHRPQSLGGFIKELDYKLLSLALSELKTLKPTKVIAGGALGWDTALALATIELNIPLELHIPCLNYQSKWPLDSQVRYNKILEQAQKVIYIGSTYNISLLHKRNISMVDSCDMLLALFNGVPKGGTYSCIQYASSKGKLVINLWDKWCSIQ